MTVEMLLIHIGKAWCWQDRWRWFHLSLCSCYSVLEFSPACLQGASHAGLLRCYWRLLQRWTHSRTWPGCTDCINSIVQCFDAVVYHVRTILSWSTLVEKNCWHTFIS